MSSFPVPVSPRIRQVVLLLATFFTTASTDCSAPLAPTLVVDVCDNGPGVPPELSDRIYDPFFTTKVKGTGLGLGIVRKIVDAHDGRIDLNSSPDTGTRFRVTLPVSSTAAPFK